jgi:hypothetical protein
MKSRKLMFAGLMVCLALTLSGFYCNESQVHKANRTAKQIADDLHEFEAKVEEQYVAGTLDKDEAKNLAQLASDATLADDQFVANLKTLKTLDAANSSLVVGWFQELADSIQKLNADGVLHIKNPKTKANFILLYQGIDAGLSTLRMLLEGLKSEIPFGPIQHAQFDSASLSIILMAFNSLAKLILQARKDGSLTDEQLQQGTLDENADTRNHAAAFIKQLEGQ